jgi:hypothetical protein
MPLNLSSVTITASKPLGEYEALRLEDAITLADARRLIAYINSIPNINLSGYILAMALHTTTRGTAKMIEDNGGLNLPLCLSFSGKAIMMAIDPREVNAIYQTSEAQVGELNIAQMARTLMTKPFMGTPIEAFLLMLGFTMAQIATWKYSLPAVQEFIKEQISAY